MIPWALAQDARHALYVTLRMPRVWRCVAPYRAGLLRVRRLPVMTG